MRENMATPKVAQKGPYVLDVEPRKYAWCTCGLSKTQPYCDASHKGTDMRSMTVEIKEKQQVAFCGCKHTKTPPFCDGSHNDL
jgi:CDGSH-type Zn-finger protein